MALALGIMALFDTATNLVNPAARHYIALAVTILGIGLIVGAFAGRARWLILVGVLTLPFLFASPGLEYDFNGTSGGTVYVTPEDFGDLALSYEQGIGELVIDLRELPWSGQAIPLDARVDIGQLSIIVPDTVEVSGTGETAIGLVEFERQQSAGLGSEITFEQSGSDAGGSIELVASVGIGHLEIDRRSMDN